MSKPKEHIFHNRTPDGRAWEAWCGHTSRNGARSVRVEDSTCLRCVQQFRDRRLWKAEIASQEARQATERLESLRRRRARKAKA